MDVIEKFKKDVKNQEVILLGGGNSFNPEIIPKLKNDKIICLNAGSKFVPDALAIAWMDSIWPAENEKLITNHLAEYKFYIRDNVTTNKEIKGPYDSIYINRISPYCDYSTIKKGEMISVRGNNSGCCIIDLLIQCQVSKIVLLGFDCKMINRKSHFHKEYKHAMPPEIYTKQFIPCFENLSKYAKRANVDIVNLSTDSNLKCFKFESTEKYLSK